MKKDLFGDLDPLQKDAVKAVDGPVLILAGAGSGKTRVLTYKIAYLMQKGVRAENILAITFTNKAANEMKERVHKLIVDSSSFIEKETTDYEPLTMNHSPYVGTFHAFCAKLLRIDGKHIGLPTGFLIYDTEDSLSLIRRIMKDLNITSKSFKPSSMLNAISGAKGELIDPSQYAEFARGSFAQTVSSIYKVYQKELAEIGACDFDDLLMRTVKLLEANPLVLRKYAERFQYVLVDEYQDVNTSQYILTKLLASHHGNLTVVGDAAQAIYSFRGADFRNILNFERDFPKVRIFNLEQNYRSTQNILSAANMVISKNRAHPVLKLWTQNTDGEKITIYNAQNEIGEVDFVVERISNSTMPYSAFAVLYRTNAQSRTIEEGFLRAGIPYKLYGGVRFYDRKEVKDVLSYLRLIANPKDSVARARCEKLGKARYKKFAEMVSELTSKSGSHPEQGPTLGSESGDSKILDRVENDKKRKLPTPVELIDKVLESTGYLLLIDDGTEQGLMRVENVKELKSVAQDFESIDMFLESIALMEGKTTPDKSYEIEANSVTLMTIHAAKGLEFDNVFIIGMEEGLFPHSRSMMDPAQIEEERRLAYVAMTRARHKLYLSYASRRLYFGSVGANLVSRFVVDIPEELISAI